MNSTAVKTMISTSTLYNSGTWATSVMPEMPRIASEKDLNNEAFNTPLEALRNMWLAKFGNRWVMQTDLDHEDRFFYLAVYRLQQAFKIEFVELNDKRMFRVPPE